jgi:hypothetical protein
MAHHTAEEAERKDAPVGRLPQVDLGAKRETTDRREKQNKSYLKETKMYINL